jgi:hypothetical protein
MYLSMYQGGDGVSAHPDAGEQEVRGQGMKKDARGEVGWESRPDPKGVCMSAGGGGAVEAEGPRGEGVRKEPSGDAESDDEQVVKESRDERSRPLSLVLLLLLLPSYTLAMGLSPLVLLPLHTVATCPCAWLSTGELHLRKPNTSSTSVLENSITTWYMLAAAGDDGDAAGAAAAAADDDGDDDDDDGDDDDDDDDAGEWLRPDTLASSARSSSHITPVPPCTAPATVLAGGACTPVTTGRLHLRRLITSSSSAASKAGKQLARMMSSRWFSTKRSNCACLLSTEEVLC